MVDGSCPQILLTDLFNDTLTTSSGEKYCVDFYYYHTLNLFCFYSFFLLPPLFFIPVSFSPDPSPRLPSAAHPADTEPPGPARPLPSGPDLQAAAPALLRPAAVHPAEFAALLGPAE